MRFECGGVLLDRVAQRGNRLLARLDLLVRQLWVYKWMDGRTDGRMDGWMDVWMDGRMDGCMIRLREKMR